MMQEKLALITGASGFVGSALAAALQGRNIRRALRQKAANAQPGDIVVGDISTNTDWQAALTGVDCVTHLAARTHVLREDAADPLAAYRRVNVEGTMQLARQAATAGVRRFVFLSSIKVNGESTPERPFTEADTPMPEDAYGVSKLEAETGLREIAAQSGMELVIIRAPLVYGPGVQGNFLRLMNFIERGLPLPLASVRNRRSLVYVGNLADAVVSCMDLPSAAGKTFLVSDGDDVSTPELIRRLASAMGRPARLLPCPVRPLQWGAAISGQSGALARLTGSLAVDSSSIRNTLGWHPRISLDQGLIETARWYHQAQFQRGN